ncbi:MAG: TetR/AcrR family transcriptional regulator [Acidimicrobiales bacterium]|nr:TetR/AcrR family transcriptional regulator [Acidimicrobiales bacterium]
MIKADATSTPSKLLDAALVEFAAHGYDAASTRAIAARAGVHQPQINYHFSSKAALWRAAVDHLFAQLAADIAPAVTAAGDDRARFAAAVRAFVHFAAAHPELNRIMVHESTVESDRLRWLVDTHVRAAFAFVTSMWHTLRTDPATPPIDETVLYYLLVGGASLLYVNAAEARLLRPDLDPTDPSLIDAHADALVALLLGLPVPSGPEPAGTDHPIPPPRS